MGLSLLDRIVDRVLDRLVPLIERKVDELRDEALKMIAAELPKIGAAVAESTVQAVFDRTQIDEAADSVSNVVAGIFDRLPIIGRPR